MSERPEASVPGTTARPPMWGGWAPSANTPWGKSLWGTTIDYGMGQKLVIDENGIGRYTDAAGETGTWDPYLFGWRADDDTFKDSTFGIPGMEMTTEQVEAIIERLELWVDELQSESPEASRAIRDRAMALWDAWHNPETDPYPYP